VIEASTNTALIPKELSPADFDRVKQALLVLNDIYESAAKLLPVETRQKLALISRAGSAEFGVLTVLNGPKPGLVGMIMQAGKDPIELFRIELGMEETPG
jgi:hypothetical protein